MLDVRELHDHRRGDATAVHARRSRRRRARARPGHRDHGHLDRVEELGRGRSRRPARAGRLGGSGLAGTPVEGSVLAATPGSWSDPAARFGYAWLRCDGGTCSTIADAGAAAYTLTAEDVGFVIVVAVSATNAGGTTTALSAPAGPVLPAAPTATAAPSISGEPRVGSTLTGDPGSWSDAAATLAYAWQRCDQNGACTTIADATAAAYTLTAEDVGFVIVVAVSATNAGGTTTALSAPAGPVLPAAPTATAAPSISGEPRVGSTLTGDPGSWSDAAATLAYAWQRCDQNGACTTIADATAAAYTLTAEDVGFVIVVAVSATNAGGTTTALSAPAGPVLPAPAPDRDGRTVDLRRAARRLDPDRRPGQLERPRRHPRLRLAALRPARDLHDDRRRHRGRLHAHARRPRPPDPARGDRDERRRRLGHRRLRARRTRRTRHPDPGRLAARQFAERAGRPCRSAQPRRHGRGSGRRLADAVTTPLVALPRTHEGHEGTVGRRAAVALVIVLIAAMAGAGAVLAHEVRQREQNALDAHLDVALQAALSEAGKLAAKAQQDAAALAARPALQRALADGDRRALARLTANEPGAAASLPGRQGGTASAPPMLRRAVDVYAGGRLLGTVSVSVPLDGAFLSRLRNVAPLQPGEGFLLARGDRIFAAPASLEGERLRRTETASGSPGASTTPRRRRSSPRRPRSSSWRSLRAPRSTGPSPVPTACSSPASSRPSRRCSCSPACLPARCSPRSRRSRARRAAR